MGTILGRRRLAGSISAPGVPAAPETPHQTRPAASAVCLVAAALVALSASVASPLATPQGDGGAASEARAARAFVADLHQACARDDRHVVASLVRYPITVRVGPVRIPMRDAAALVASYELVFTDDVKAAIARAGAWRPGQGTASGLVATGDGFAIGKGLIRITRVGDVFRITSIDLPVPPAVAGPGVPAPGPAAVSGRPGRAAAAPRRVMFHGGQRTARLVGTLAPGAKDSYVVHVSQGQLLDVAIEGVRGREVVAYVFDATGRAPLDARAAEGARRWTGRVPDGADYRIDVGRGAPTRSDPTGYTLVVSVR
jgi:hypothetical protein